MAIRNIFLIFLIYSVFLAQKTEASDIWAGFAAPVTTPARTWLIAGAGLTAALIIFQDQIGDPLQRDCLKSRPLGKFSTVAEYGGRMYTNIIYTGGMFLASALGSESSADKGKVMLEASVYSAATSTLLKITVREPRPNDGSDKKSFPSGHTAGAFAFASVVGAEDGWAWGIPAYTFAAVTAYSRMNDNKHRLHDVVAGATIGVSYGLGIHYLRKRDTSSNAVSIAPIWDSDQKGIEVGYRF
ncbi:MAG: phosphatase PAP2 family protein [Bdellovibrionota bacterium]